MGIGLCLSKYTRMYSHMYIYVSVKVSIQTIQRFKQAGSNENNVMFQHVI